MPQDPIPTFDEFQGARRKATAGKRPSLTWGAPRKNHKHQGEDFGGATDTPVGVPDDGEVVFAAPNGNMGNTVAVRHAGGLVTRYGHLNRINVQSGARVTRGQDIGLLGSTGNAKGPHVHYEVLKEDLPVDPANSPYRAPIIGRARPSLDSRRPERSSDVPDFDQYLAAQRSPQPVDLRPEAAPPVVEPGKRDYAEGGAVPPSTPVFPQSGRTDEFAPPDDAAAYAREQQKFSQIDTVGMQAVDLMARQRQAQAAAQQRASLMQRSAARRAQTQQQSQAAQQPPAVDTGIGATPGSPLAGLFQREKPSLIPRSVEQRLGVRPDESYLGRRNTPSHVGLGAGGLRRLDDPVVKQQRAIEQELRRQGPGLPPLRTRLLKRGLPPEVVGQVVGDSGSPSVFDSEARKGELEARQTINERIASKGPVLGAIAQQWPAFVGHVQELGSKALRMVNTAVSPGSYTPGNLPKPDIQVLNDVSDYLARRAEINKTIAGYNPPKLDLPEKVAREIIRQGYNVAQIAATVEATGLSLPVVMAGESVVLNSDKDPATQAKEAAKAYAFGWALTKLPVFAQQGLGKVPGAVGRTVTRHPEAAARTIGAGTFGGLGAADAKSRGADSEEVIAEAVGGALIGGGLAGGGLKRIGEHVKGIPETAIKTEWLPEPVRTAAARAKGYEPVVVQTNEATPRFASVYYKSAKEQFVQEISPEQAASFTRAAKGEKARPFIEVEPTDFDRVAGFSTSNEGAKRATTEVVPMKRQLEAETGTKGPSSETIGPISGTKPTELGTVAKAAETIPRNITLPSEAAQAGEIAPEGPQALAHIEPKQIVRHSDPNIDGGEVVGRAADGRLKVQNKEGGISLVQDPRKQGGNREAALSRAAGLKGSDVEPPGSQASLQGGPTDAEMLSDITSIPAFREKGLGGLDVPVRAAVLSRVLRAIQDPKVRDGVVELVPVNVVNQLSRMEPASHVSLHDKAVLRDLLSVDEKGSVSVRSDVADSLVRGVAGFLAKSKSVELKGSGLSMDPDPALSAGGVVSGVKDALAGSTAEVVRPIRPEESIAPQEGLFTSRAGKVDHEASIPRKPLPEVGSVPVPEPPSYGEPVAQPAASTPSEGPHGITDFTPAPSGGIDYGAIEPDVAKQINRQAAPIRLQVGDERFGQVHIQRAEEGHRIERITEAGYTDERHLVADVAQNHTQIWQARGQRLMLVKPNGGNKIAIVELAPSEQGDSYNVVTANIVRPDYPKTSSGKLLWERGALPPQPDTGSSGPTSSTPSGFTPGQTAAGARGQSNILPGPEPPSYGEPVLQPRAARSDAPEPGNVASIPPTKEQLKEGGPENDQQQSTGLEAGRTANPQPMSDTAQTAGGAPDRPITTPAASVPEPQLQPAKPSIAVVMRAGEGGFHEGIEERHSGLPLLRSLFGNRPRADTVAPASESPTVEARMKAAEGIQPPSVIERAREGARNVYRSFKRTFPEIDPNKDDVSAVVNDTLRQYMASPSYAKALAYDKLADITRNLGKNRMKVFSRAIQLPDILKDIENGKYEGKSLPFGYESKEQIERDLARNIEVAERTPAIKDALERRAAFVRSLTEHLVRLDLLPREVLDDPRYYHRQVMAYVGDPAWVGTGSRDIRLKEKGFQKGRIGGGDFNTRYAEAEFEWVSQAISLISRKETLERVKQVADLKPALDLQAKVWNAANTGTKTWEDFIPETHTVWQPTKGNHFFPALTIAERTLNKIFGGTKQFEEADVRQILTLGGKREQWVLPKEIAKTLDDFQPVRDEGPVDNLWVQMQSSWKQWVLLNPLRALKYNLNNLSGDLDIALAYDPRILRHYYSAARALWSYQIRGLGNAALKAEVQDALKRGVVDSGISIAEIPDINRTGAFRTLTSDDPNVIQKGIQAYWSGVKGFTTWRENTLRLAAFRHFKGQIAKGKTVYGASTKSQIDAIKDPEDRAAKLARELIGDYGSVSVAGQWIRRHLIPFYSWTEINAPRYARLMRNLPDEGRSSGRAGASKAAGTAARTAAKALGLAVKASTLFILAQIWNHQMFPDEEKKLRREGRENHIILGTNDDGSIRTLRVQGALADALEWFGASDYPSDIRDVASGKSSVQAKVAQAPKEAANKIIQGLEPFTKTIMELALGRSAYPSIFREGPGFQMQGRPIRDRGEYAARVFSLDSLYRRVTGRPRPKSSGGVAAIVDGVVTYRTDPGEAAYWEIRGKVMDWAQDRGREFSLGADPTERGNALYYFKQATKWADEKAAKKWLAEYQRLGGTEKGMEQSIRMGHPLGMIKRDDWQAFVDSLSPEDKEALKMSAEWYKRTYGGVAEVEKPTGARPPRAPREPRKPRQPVQPLKF